MARVSISRKDIINEIMTMVPCKWQNAKKILELSEKPVETFQMIFSGIARRPMSKNEADRYVSAARKRIELIDSVG